MANLLCLTWNNHYLAFNKLLSSILLKDLYCDATIVCHGKYYPVHRLVLSMCSDYFEEIFNQTKCKHPFIIIKDVKPQETEALLNYMYKGEVKVSQESLPDLIKAAESLQVKGLAVPDDISNENISSKQNKRYSEYIQGADFKKRKNDDKEKQILEKDETKNDVGDTHHKRLLEDIWTNEANSPSSDISTPNGGKLQTLQKDDPANVIQGANVDLKLEDVEIYSESDTIHTEEIENSTQQIFEPQISQTEFDFVSPDKFSNGPFDYEFDGLQPPSSQNSLEDNSLIGKVQPRRLSISRTPEHFKCPECPYKSQKKYNVKSHYMYRHTDIRPICCQFCSFRCIIRSDLKRHMFTHTRTQIDQL